MSAVNPGPVESTDCDPLGWLDHPERALDLAERLVVLASRSSIDGAHAAEIEGLIAALQPAVAAATAARFLHNDVHDMNLICSRGGTLLAVIDWGDAGWGDPAIEFAQVPIQAVPYVLEGYRAEAPGILGDATEARILWDKLDYALRALQQDPPRRFPLEELRGFIRANRPSWELFL